MDWKDIAGTVGKAAPLLGTLLGGPAGTAVGAIIASTLGTGGSPAEVAQALANPDAMVKLREVEARRQVDLEGLATDLAKAQINAAAQNAGDVNKTMQAEAAAEHWPSYSWRPFIGFMFGLYFASMWILPLLGKQPVPLTPDLTLAVGGILGIASWFRGKMQADPAVPTVNKG